MTAVVADEPTLASDAVASAPAFTIARALGRVEGRRLLLSPPVIAAAALMLLAQTRGTGQWVSSITQDAADSAFLALLVAAVTLVTSNLATLRARRHGAEELFDSLPAPASARTGGHLLAVLWPAVAAVGIPVSLLLAGNAYGSVGPTELADLAVGPLLVAGAGALGVMLARWVPSPLAGPLACVAIAALELFLISPALITTGWRWMAFWVGTGDFVLLPPRPSAWHVLYLSALIAMAVVGALLRDGLRRRVVIAGVAAVVVMATSAVAQGRSLTDAAWARANAHFTDPERHQVCEIRSDVRYCAFPAFRPLVDRWSPPVEGVRRSVPATAWPSAFGVTQRITSVDLQYAPREALRDRLPDLPAPAMPQVDDGSLHPGVGWTDDGVAELNVAVAAASRVLGLPLAPPTPGLLCSAAGQGRAVVALWLAAQATPDAGPALRRLAEHNVVRLPAVSGETTAVLILTGDGVEPAVGWGKVELAHALALLDRPAAAVREELTRQWDRIAGPAATTDEVAAALGLPPAAVDHRHERDAAELDPHAPPRTLRLGPPCRSWS